LSFLTCSKKQKSLQTLFSCGTQNVKTALFH